MADGTAHFHLNGGKYDGELVVRIEFQPDHVEIGWTGQE